MKRLKTKEQVLKWMMMQFESTGEPRAVPGTVMELPEAVTKAMLKEGVLTSESYYWDDVIETAYYGPNHSQFYFDDEQVEMSGELAILCFRLCYWFVAHGPAAIMSYRDLFELMLRTHGGLPGVTLALQHSQWRLKLSRKDGAPYDTSFNVVL